jgi:hypothetical protein
MHRSKFIPRLITLEPGDYRIVREYAQQSGQANLDFSAAVRSILRDWFTLRMIALASEQFRSARPSTPRVSLQEEIQRIKSSARSCQPPVEVKVEPYKTIRRKSVERQED